MNRQWNKKENPLLDESDTVNLKAGIYALRYPIFYVWTHAELQLLARIKLVWLVIFGQKQRLVRLVQMRD